MRPLVFILVTLLVGFPLVSHALQCNTGMTFSTTIDNPSGDCVLPKGQVVPMNISQSPNVIGSSAVKYNPNTQILPPAIGGEGLQLWLDATDPNGNGIYPANNTPIAVWKDKSGRGNHAAQTTIANQPSYYSTTHTINGKPAIYFDGTASSMTIPPSLMTSLPNTLTATIFIVASFTNFTNPSVVPTTSYIMSDGPNFSIAFPANVPGVPQNPNHPPSTVSIPTTAQINWLYGDTTLSTYGTDTDHPTDATLLNIYKNWPNVAGSFFFQADVVTPYVWVLTTNNGMSIYRNKVLVQNTGADTFTSTNPLTIGYDGTSATYWQGNIGEIIIYNTTLTDDQRNNVTTYLTNKWNIKDPTPPKVLLYPGTSAFTDDQISGVTASNSVDGDGNTVLTTSSDVSSIIIPGSFIRLKKIGDGAFLTTFDFMTFNNNTFMVNAITSNPDHTSTITTTTPITDSFTDSLLYRGVTITMNDYIGNPQQANLGSRASGYTYAATTMGSYGGGTPFSNDVVNNTGGFFSTMRFDVNTSTAGYSGLNLDFLRHSPYTILILDRHHGTPSGAGDYLLSCKLDDSSAAALKIGYKSNTEFYWGTNKGSSSMDFSNTGLPGIGSDGPLYAIIRLVADGQGNFQQNYYTGATYTANPPDNTNYVRGTDYSASQTNQTDITICSSPMLGQDISGNPYNGDLITVMMFDRALSPVEINAIESYWKDMIDAYGSWVIRTNRS